MKKENQIRRYTKQMSNNWKERQSFKVTAKVVWTGQDDQDEWVANRTRDQCNQKNMMNKNTDKSDQNGGNDEDDDDQYEATENECEECFAK